MNKRLSTERQSLVLAALCEGTPVNAVCRMFRVDKAAVLRIIRETGEAFADYMDKEFRDLPCSRIEMDEQWQYVGIHAGRMTKPTAVYEKRDKTRGDFWLWACIDADSKLVFSHKIGKRDRWTGREFVQDVRERVKGPVQIATDNFKQYPVAHSGSVRIRGLQLRHGNKGVWRAGNGRWNVGASWKERRRSQDENSAT
jgi:IS1 family transposase